MDFKLYVGNLPYTVTTDDLKQLFAGAGNVTDAVVIIDRQTNRSKGFGFITMSSQEEMNKAIEMFNEKDFQGRNLRVNPARPQEERRP